MIDYLADIQTLTKEFLTERQKELQEYLRVNNRNATGKSSRSIQLANINPNGGQLVGATWIGNVFTGRGPGKMPPISAIIDWLNARGLPRAMAWAVAKKIAREGTELYKAGGLQNRTNIVTQEQIDEFSKKIADMMVVEISSDIKGIFV